MIRTPFSTLVFATGLTFGSLLFTACGPGPADAQDSVTSGTIGLPLTATAGGHTYRLRNTRVDIYGAIFTSLFSTVNPEERELSATLPTGSYNAYLSYWSLERDDGQGTFTVVPAVLTSGPFLSFRIFNGTTSTISFQFEVDEELVTIGTGTVDVTVSITERPSA